MFVEENRYHLIETLGEGGMGIVQNVHDRYLRREVARKSLKNSEEIYKLSPQDRFKLIRIRTEALITATLEHPNIVPIYDILKDKEGTVSFTMRKIQGQTLRFLLIQALQDLSVGSNNFLPIFLKICDAVSYAHSRGVIHRDLKPDNIMVGRFGEVYVVDWGIAKRVHENEEKNLPKDIFFNFTLGEQEELKTNGILGTRGYMPKEQIDNASVVTFQSDIFALGQILKECFTYISPDQEFRTRIQGEKSSEYISLKKKLPPDIEAIVNKATQEDYRQRYHSVRELKEDLERYLSNVLVNARKYTLWEICGKWISRHKRSISINISIAILLFCGYFFFKRQLQEERRLTQQQKQQAFRKLYLEALAVEKQAEKISATHKIDQERKMGQLMLSLETLNKASMLSTDLARIQQSKAKIGKKLIDIACKIGEYKLATYVANDIQLLQDFVKEAQQQKLKTYHTKLDAWEKELQKTIIPQWSQEEALLDIAKMQDEEIFKRLVGYIEKGTEYFLEENQAIEPNPALYRFYTVIAEALGSFRDPKAREPLLIALEKMSFQMSKIPEGKRSPHKHKYMAALCKSLLLSKSKAVAHELEKIRERMGSGGHFWRVSREIYIKLVQNEKADQVEVKTTQEYFKRGLLRLRTESYLNSIADFTEVLRQDPAFTEAYYFLGIAKIQQGHLESNTHIHKANEHMKQAVEYLNIYLELSPSSFRGYRDRGDAKSFLKENEGALQDYNKAIQIGPNHYNVYSKRANIRDILGNNEGALSDYNIALQMNPNDPDLYMSKAILHFRSKNFELAYQDFTQVIKINSSYGAYYNRGLVLAELKRYQEAIEDFSKSIELNSKPAESYGARGDVKYTQGHYQEAIFDYDQAILLQPQYTPIYKKRAHLQKILRQEEASIQDYQKIMELAPNDIESACCCAKIYIKQNKYEEAIRIYTQVIHSNPPNAELYNNRGQAKMALAQDYQDAFNDFQRALEIKPDFAEVFYNLGILFEKQEDFENAIHFYEKGFQQQFHPDVQEKLNELLLSIACRLLHTRKFEELYPILLKLEQYLPENHKMRPKVKNRIKQIKPKIKIK